MLHRKVLRSLVQETNKLKISLNLFKYTHPILVYCLKVVLSTHFRTAPQKSRVVTTWDFFYLFFD